MAGTPLFTPRDLEILQALEYVPLTVPQLLKFSETFACPFTDERRVRERMQILAASGRVRRFQYATIGRSAPNYYTLSRFGYQLLHGADAVPPTKRAFDPVALAHQHHTSSLADFIVHTALASHRASVTFTGFYRENTLKLHVGEETLYPDCAFQLLLPPGGELSFFVELDNSTERVRSEKDLDSWQRKIRLYDRLQDSSAKRFRVLVVTTRSTERLHHILATAAETLRNPKRSLLYGISLARFLVDTAPLTVPCFLDQRGCNVALVQRVLQSALPHHPANPVLVNAGVSALPATLPR